MRPFRAVVALLLALLWLPATLHCGLETVGLLEHGSACCPDEHAAPENPAHCGADNCVVVESGDYHPTQSWVKVSAPSAVPDFFCLFAVAPSLAVEPEIVASVEVESPPELRRTWHFLARAALLPGAPSVIAAA